MIEKVYEKYILSNKIIEIIYEGNGEIKIVLKRNTMISRINYSSIMNML